MLADSNDPYLKKYYNSNTSSTACTWRYIQIKATKEQTPTVQKVYQSY